MKKFTISSGIHNTIDKQFQPVTIQAETWKSAITKAIRSKLIPEDGESVQILEVPEEDNDDEEEENLLALHFREWREDKLIEKYLSSLEG
jgi:hypothetical protein